MTQMTQTGTRDIGSNASQAQVVSMDREAAYESGWWCGQEVASCWVLSSQLIVDT